YESAKYCQESIHTCRDLSSTLHGTCTWEEARCWLSSISRSSASFTPRLSRGLSRYQMKNSTAQTSPMQPNSSNACRQDMKRITCTTSSGVNAPPQRALIHKMPCARTLSFSGSQVLNALVRFGKQPASPAPNRKRVAVIDAKLNAHPVAAVKNDHQI